MITTLNEFKKYLNESHDKPSLDEVNAHIQSKYQKLRVLKHHDTAGSFYWDSEDDALGTYLAGLYSTTVEGVARTEQQNLDTWMKEADEIMAGYKTYEKLNAVNEEFAPVSDDCGVEVKPSICVAPPNVLHTLLIIQSQLKLAHWQTKIFAQHKALDEAYSAISEKADLLAEAYMGKKGDAGKYVGNRVIGIVDFKSTEDIKMMAEVLSASLSMCAMTCMEGDSELMNIVEEMKAEFDKLKYLLSLS